MVQKCLILKLSPSAFFLSPIALLGVSTIGAHHSHEEGKMVDPKRLIDLVFV